MNQQMNKSACNPNWQPGVSGNPRGRPPGSRQKIAEALLRDIGSVRELRGAEVLERLADEDPAALAKIVSGFLPRELAATLAVQTAPPGNLSPEDWAQLVGTLDTVKALGAVGAPGEIATRIEHALHTEFAKPLPQLEVLPPAIPPCPIPRPEDASSSQIPLLSTPIGGICSIWFEAIQSYIQTPTRFLISA